MSISLDVHFLSNDDFSTKPPATIFDELDGFFAISKDIPPDVPTAQPVQAPANSTDFLNSDHSKSNKRLKAELDNEKSSCGIPSLTSSDFLLNEETHEDQQLYIVEEDGLKPITSPFMVPGIYKKIPRSSKVANDEDTDRVTSKNVFISATEKSGKIVAATVFREAYVNLDEEGETFEEAVEEQQEQVPDSLTMLAYDILKLSNRDNIVIDRERNEIIRHQDKLNRKTIYRFLTPQTLGLTHEMLATLFKSETMPKLPVKSKRGRPRKNKEQPHPTSPPPQSAPKPTPPPTPPQNIQRTRSGRIVKPSSNAPPPPPAAQPESDGLESENAAAFMRNFLQELKDSEYICKLSPTSHEAPTTQFPRKRRNFSPDFICPTCKKIFLGKRRMQQHFQSFPDHRPNHERQRILEEMSLFKFLVSKVQRASLPEDQRADVFLSELSDLVKQLQARSSRLIRNTSGMQFVNSRTAKVLGIPEGHYSLDVNAIEAPPDPIVHFESLAPPPVPRMDYNLSISLDDTLTEAKLNLSGPIPSEESLLRTVDDLMKEGMKKLDPDFLNPARPPVIHYDHASDNAVEAVSMKETTQAAPILDLSLDLFQFNSN